MTHRIFRLVRNLFLALSLAVIASGPLPARAAGPWYVAPTGSNSNDCLSASTPCETINGAIGKATGGDTILVAEGMYTGSSSEVILINRDITLSGGWDASFTSQSGNSIIDGEATRRGITVQTGVTTSLAHFVLQNGNKTGGGGGVHNEGTLTLNHSIIADNNSGFGEGGGILNTTTGVITMNQTVLTRNGNQDLCNGTAIWNQGTITANNSSITENQVPNIFCGVGSAVINFTGPDYRGTIILNNTTVSNNSPGGGIYNYGNLTLNNSTISHNVGDDSNGPGGIYNSIDAILILNNSTITGNTTSGSGGGIFNISSGVVTMQNTIVAGNTASNTGPDCSGSIGSSGYNLVSNAADCSFNATTGDETNLDPFLGSLQDNGGPTLTHALLPQSAAIDGGNPAGCKDQDGNLLTTDQRGITRPQGIACDIGAYEYTFTTPGPATSIAILSGSGQLSQPNMAFPKPLRVVALDNEGNRISGVPVTFTAPASGPSGTFSDTGTNTTSVDTAAGGVATSSIFTANDQAGAYTVSASAPGLGSVNFSLEQISRPSNDNFTDATDITSLPVSSTVDITNATNEPGEPQFCQIMDRTVWYSFTPTETMRVRANIQGSAPNGNVNIYRALGSGISDLEFLNCSGAAASVNFSAEANQTYYLQAGSDAAGNLQITLEQIPPVANDDFANAVSVSTLPFSDARDTSTATSASDDPIDCHNNGSVWYQFTPSRDLTIMANTFGSHYDTTLGVYTGSRGALELLPGGCNDDFSGLQSRVVFNAIGGTTYYFMLGFCCGNGGTGGSNLIFSVEEYIPIPPEAIFFFFPTEPTRFDNIQFIDNSIDPEGVGIQTWEWDFGDGTPPSTDIHPTHMYAADGDYSVTLTVTTLDGRMGSTTQVIQVRTQFAFTIDIKPGSQTNPINMKSLGKIPVAILSAPDFNAVTEIDRTSLTFGSTGDEHSLVACNKRGTDVNGDGLKDLVCHFKTKLTGFKLGDTEGILRGLTLGGVTIEARDVVRVLHTSYP